MNAREESPLQRVLQEEAKEASKKRERTDADKQFMMMLVVGASEIIARAVSNKKPFAPRASPVFAQRMKWDEFVATNGHREDFRRLIRMPLESFNRLLAIIHGNLQVDEIKASGRGGAILPEISLFCTLRYLAGASYLDVQYATGISKQAFFHAIYKTFDALVTSDVLAVKFPGTKEDCCALADGFQRISYDGVINNCVGAIDGYLVLLKVPAKQDVGNQKSYFSGHYKTTGLNLQAVCDHNCRFTFFALAAPGGANDRDAIRETNLLDLLRRTPSGYVLIADAAYEPSEKIIPMFFGASKKVADFDNFNFFASQCRTRIEMAFGIMRQKWGILARPLLVRLKNAQYVLMSIAILHNYIIDERLRRKGVAHDPEFLHIVEQQQGMLFEPSQPTDDNGDPIFYLDDGLLDINAILPGVWRWTPLALCGVSQKVLLQHLQRNLPPHHHNQPLFRIDCRLHYRHRHPWLFYHAPLVEKIVSRRNLNHQYRYLPEYYLQDWSCGAKIPTDKENTGKTDQKSKVQDF